MVSFFSNLFRPSGKSRCPQFLIIGAQKSGTTTLYDLLDGHPGFCGSSEKEAGFFTKDIFYNQGLEWYLKKFKHCRRDTLKFEATPVYIYRSDVAEKIFLFDNNMKFIVLLREPAARCYSAWNMFRRFNETSPEHIYEQFVKSSNPATKEALSNLLFTKKFPTFKQAVEDDIERYITKSDDIEPSFVRRGIYFEQIQNYLKYFSLDDFLFVEQRELNSPGKLLQKISNFLKVTIDISAANIAATSNVGAYVPVSAEIEETLLLLRNFYMPHNEALFDKIGITYDWNEST